MTADDDEYEELIRDGTELARDAGKAHLALDAFVRALELRPGDATALYGQVYSLRRMGSPERAAEILDEALALHPGDDRLRRERIRVAAALGRLEAAVEAALELGRADDVATLLDRLVAGLAPEPALGALSRLAERPDRTAAVLAKRAELQLLAGDAEAALAAFDDIHRLDPDDAAAVEAAVLGAVAVRRRQGFRTDAERRLRLALRPPGDRPRLWLELADVLLEDRRPAAAVDALLRAGREDLIERKADELGKTAGPAAATGFLEACLSHVPDRPGLLLRLGEAQRSAGDHTAALETARRAVALDPDDRAARRLLVVAAYESERYTEAERYAREAADALPGDAGPRRLLGAILAARGEYGEAVRAWRAAGAAADGLAAVHERLTAGRLDEAARLLAAVRAADPGDPGAIVAAADLALARRRPEEAAELYAEALGRGPEDPRALTGRIRALQAAGRTADAIARGREALLERPGPDVWEALGAVYLAAGEWDEAGAAYAAADRLDALLAGLDPLLDDGRRDEAAAVVTAALRLRPRSRELLEQAGLIALARYDVAAAQRYAADLDRYNPHSIEAVNLRLVCLTARREWRKLRVALDDALRVHRGNSDVLLAAGRACLALGDRAEAMRIANDLLALGPSPKDGAVRFAADVAIAQHRYAMARDLLARVGPEALTDPATAESVAWQHLGISSLPEARRLFDAVLARNPRRPWALTGQAVHHEILGDLAAAETACRAALALDPGEPVLMRNLAWNLVKQDGAERHAEAETLCRRADVIDPGSPETARCLGALASARGDVREAEVMFRRSAEIDRRGGALPYLGELLVRAGRVDEGLAVFDLALDDDPDNEETYIEAGNSLLVAGRVTLAETRFRRALETERDNARAALGLAAAQARLSPPQVAEAIAGLRELLRTAALSRRDTAAVRRALSRLLSLRYEETDDRSYLKQALAEAGDALVRCEDPAQAYFERAVIKVRLDDLPGAFQDIRRCLRRDGGHVDALHARRLLREDSRRRALTQGAPWQRAVLFGLFAAQLVAVWVLFLLDRVGPGALQVLIPLTAALLVFAVALPRLLEFKLPGVSGQFAQADLDSLLRSELAGLSFPTEITTISALRPPGADPGSLTPKSGAANSFRLGSDEAGR